MCDYHLSAMSNDFHNLSSNSILSTSRMVNNYCGMSVWRVLSVCVIDAHVFLEPTTTSDWAAVKRRQVSLVAFSGRLPFGTAAHAGMNKGSVV